MNGVYQEESAAASQSVAKIADSVLGDVPFSQVMGRAKLMSAMFGDSLPKGFKSRLESIDQSKLSRPGASRP